MNLSKAVEGYIVHKRSLGMAFRSEAVRLHAFVKAVGNCDMRFTKPVEVRQYLDGTGPVTYFWFSKYHTLTAFYRYAVVRLVTWYREGKNVQRLLPHLSVYLGHGRLQDTQRYLTMTTELLKHASRCFEQYARPEVPHV